MTKTGVGDRFRISNFGQWNLFVICDLEFLRLHHSYLLEAISKIVDYVQGQGVDFGLKAERTR